MKTVKGLLAILLALLLGLATATAALAADTNFPLMAIGGVDLVADQDTEFITEFKQDKDTKMITATVKVYNGGSEQSLVIQGIGIEISYNNKVAPCRSTGSGLFSPGKSGTVAEVSNYCSLLDTPINILASVRVQRGANGGSIGGKLSVSNWSDAGGALIIPPNRNASIIEFYFMPLDTENYDNYALDINTFSYDCSYDSELILRLTPWIGNGSRSLQPTDERLSSTETYVVSPKAFKIHVKRPLPNVTPDDAARVVIGYDSATMEWSASETGTYKSAAPTPNEIGDGAKDIYVRYTGGSYGGSDGVFSNYKKYLQGDLEKVVFVATGDIKIVTVTFNANGGTDGSFKSKNVEVGKPYGALPVPTRSNWGFTGWFTDITEGSAVTSDTKVTNDKNHTLYARWSDQKVTVTFNANGGVLSNGQTRMTRDYYLDTEYGDMPSVSRSGYYFNGWFTSATGGTQVYVYTHVTASHEIFAHWSTEPPATPPPTTPPIGGGTTFIPDIDTPLAGFTSDHIPFISGYPDGSVKPDSPITRAEVAVIFFRLLSSPEKNTPRTSAFSDVANDTWFTQEVSYLASIEILTGYPEGTFKPNQPITRAEFAAVASRFDNLATTESNAFPDIGDHWAKAYINSASAKGWVSGYPDGTFKPQQNITRAEVVKVVNTMLNRKIRVEDIPAGIKHFTDFQGHWAYAEIVEASNDHNYTRKSDGYEIWTLK